MTGRHPRPDSELVHGTCVEIGGRGVLILGPPGSGKSDLALRLIDQPGRGIGGVEMTARLVSDDQVRVSRAGDVLKASPPATIAGKIEIRGLGIVEIAYATDVPLRLCVMLSDAARTERMPEFSAQRHTILDMDLPFIEIDPRSASAPARVRAALDVLSGSHNGFAAR